MVEALNDDGADPSLIHIGSLHRHGSGFPGHVEDFVEPVLTDVLVDTGPMLSAACGCCLFVPRRRTGRKYAPPITGRALRTSAPAVRPSHCTLMGCPSPTDPGDRRPTDC